MEQLNNLEYKNYLDSYVEATQGMIGEKGITYILNDSFEELGSMVYEKDTKIVNGGRFYESNRHSKTNR